MSQSKFSDVLGTNYVPTDAEAQEIAIFCAEPEAEIANLDTEVNRLERCLSEVRHKRNTLRKLVDAHRALLSPIRRLSPELLQRIFVFCLPEDRLPVMLVSDAPLLLGRVTKGWRDIAYSTAELWTKIHVVVPSVLHPEHSLLRHQAMLEWLGRSGQLPLSFSLYASPPHGDVSSFLKPMTRLSARWQNVRLLSPARYVTETLSQLSEPSNTFPLLHSFTFGNQAELLSWSDWSPESFDPLANVSSSPFAFLTRAHNLKRVSISLHRANFPFQLLASFHTVEEIDMDGVIINLTLTEILNALNTCGKLRKCRFVGTLDSALLDSTTTTAFLPCLECLDLELISTLPDDPNSSPIFAILKNVTAPNLTTLSLSVFSDTNTLATNVEACIRRSACVLRDVAFRLYPAHNQPISLVPSLRHLSEVRHLTVQSSSWHDPASPASGVTQLFKALAITSDDPVILCPLLQRLTLIDVYEVDFDIDALQLLMRSREKGVIVRHALDAIEVKEHGSRGPIYPQMAPTQFSTSFRDILRNESQQTGVNVILPIPESRPAVSSPLTGSQ